MTDPGRFTSVSHASSIEEMAHRLSRLHGKGTFRLGVPAGPGWYRLRDLTDRHLLADWHEDLTRRHRDRKVAASFLGGWIAAAVVGIWVLPVLADGRLPLAGLDEASVHRHDGGWFDGVAVPRHPFAVLAGDPVAAGDGMVAVPDRASLWDVLADRLMQVEPVFSALRSVGRISGMVLWGMLADGIGAQALRLARLMDRDRTEAWHEARAIMDRVAARQPLLRTRPRLFPVAWGGKEEFFVVRATCCLHFRTVPNADPGGEGHCTGCPLRTDESRSRRWLEHLGRQES